MNYCQYAAPVREDHRMKHLPSSSCAAHRTRWGTRVFAGTAFVGGILAMAPTVSAAPNADPLSSPSATAIQAQPDPHVQQEMLGLVVGALRNIRANGVLDDLAGPQSRIAACLVGTIGAANTPGGQADPLLRLIPCLAPINDVDPTVVPRLVSAMDIATLASTLAAAETPHNPATPHTSPRGHATVPPVGSNTEPSTEEPNTQDTASTADPSAPERSALEPDATVPDSVVPDTSSDTAAPEAEGDHSPDDPPTETTQSSNSEYRAPTTGTLTSTFGDGRDHQGIDIANSTGTPIVAVTDGEVISAGPAQGFGLWVRIRHDDGTVTTYGHNNDNLVTVGQRVEAGEEIATVGNRGISTGPHLHFEVDTPSGKKVDPGPWLAERGATITGSDRDS